MEQRFDFDENDSFLTRMRQRFDTYRVPLWQRPAFWGGALIVIAAIFAITLLVSGLNAEKKTGAGTGGELPLIGAETDTLREAPPAADAGTLPQGGETSLFDAMGQGTMGGTPTPADGEVLTETGAPPVTRDQIAAEAETAPAGTPAGENLLAPKTDPLSAADDMEDGVMVKNGVKVIAENKVSGTEPAIPAAPAPADNALEAVTAPEATELAPPAPAEAPAADTTEAATAETLPPPPPEVEEVPSDQAAAAAPAPKAAAAGDRYVQLGSIKEESAVPSHWSKLQAKHGSLISGLSYRVVKAEIPDKGTFYRIQAGPMEAAKAADICGSLNGSSPGSCLVVKP